MSGWIGVDLDGTLAEYDGWHGIGHIGKPIKPMVDRVKRWLDEGRDVRIFTARVSEGDTKKRLAARATIIRWSKQHIGQALRSTNVKDFAMDELWDDRAVTVEANTGRALAPSRRGLDSLG